MRLIVIESPFAGDTVANLSYVQWAMRFCLVELNAAPYASHALYTQPGVLRDDIPDERRLGMRAGFSWGKVAEERGVFCDRGITSGMHAGIEQAREGRQVVRYYRIRTWITAMLKATESNPGTYALRGMPPAEEIEKLVRSLTGGTPL